MKSENLHNKQKIADNNCRIEPFGEWGLTFDAFPDHIALIGLDLTFIRVNKTFAQQLGKKPEDLVGEPCYRHICRVEDPSLRNCPHKGTIDDGKTHSVELHLDHLGGDYLVTTSPLRDRKGTICGSVHIARDITENKKAEEALRQSETRFRGLVEQSLVGIYILRDGQFLYVNPKLTEIFGYERPDEIVFGKKTLDLIAPESRALVAENDRKRLEGKEQSVRYTFKGMRKDGTIIDVEAYGSAAEIDGKPAIIGTLMDITEKLRLEKRQRDLEGRLHQQQRQQSITTLAGGIAHDFNNMLMGVLGGAELLKDNLPPGAKDRELAETIIETARRMAGLTRQLMDYSHQGTYEHQPVTLNQLIQDILGMAWSKPPAGIEIGRSLAEDLWPVLADRGQLGQVITNIIANAVEALEKTGGRIEIRSGNVAGKPAWECPLSQHPAGDYVHLSVSDTGTGIPPDMQKKIFEPFFTTKFIGRGLGLAAALGIVQNHGGCLSVESGRGKGAAFHLYLPRHVPASGTDSARPARASLGLVLVVDDEPHVLSLLKTMLTELGYEPLVVGNSADALAAFTERQDEVRLAILNVQLSGTEGAELYRRLKTLQPRLKVLISSGYDESTALSGFGADRPDGFIQKPYWIETLRDKVMDVLGTGDSLNIP
jgi:two-component system, cell cycle sensor histidine kinase and response regulator CckA